MPKIDTTYSLEWRLFSAWVHGRSAEVFLYDGLQWAGYSPWVPTLSTTQQAEGARYLVRAPRYAAECHE